MLFMRAYLRLSLAAKSRVACTIIRHAR
jgi:hypothetical protein